MQLGQTILMANVYPSFSTLSKYPSYGDISSQPDIVTMWMKSLVLDSNVCRVYNLIGQIDRVDNYDEKCKGKVNRMNFNGNILFKIANTVMNINYDIA